MSLISEIKLNPRRICLFMQGILHTKIKAERKHIKVQLLSQRRKLPHALCHEEDI